MELMVPETPQRTKVKESKEEEARAKVEGAKGLGPKLVCWIHILDGKAHLWDTFSQIGAPTRSGFPFAGFHVTSCGSQ